MLVRRLTQLTLLLESLDDFELGRLRVLSLPAAANAAANAAAGVRRLRQLQQPQEENEAVTCTGQVCPQYVSNESVLVASR